MGTVSTINRQQLDRLHIKEDLRKAIKAILKADPHALVFLRNDDTLMITGIHTAATRPSTTTVKQTTPKRVAA